MLQHTPYVPIWLIIVIIYIISINTVHDVQTLMFNSEHPSWVPDFFFFNDVGWGFLKN